MNEKAVYLQGLDDNTGRTERILLGDEFEAALKALFKAVYGKAMGGVSWSAGVLGKDVAVVWKGTPQQGSDSYYLHVSYSDGRVWS